MARENIILIDHIRTTAKKLEEGSHYMWGHMGSCNCGNVAQQITKLSGSEIHEMAMKRKGDWNDQCDDFCPTSGLPADELIATLLDAGLDLDDLKNLEKLSDKEVLKTLPLKYRYLKNNNRQHVVIYLKAWADLLEKRLLEKITLSDLNLNKKSKVIG